LEKREKTRVNYTLSGRYMDRLDHLVKEGIFLNHGEIFRASLRMIFRAYGLEPFPDKRVRPEAEDDPETEDSTQEV